MKTTHILSKTTTLALTALVFLSSLQNHTHAIAQEVETQAVAGDLDPTFGEGGKITTPFAGGSPPSAFAYAMSIQTDGKIVAVGAASIGPGNNAFAVARYNGDGSLDPGFGSGGKVTTDFSNNSDAAFAAAIQADGRLVVAGDSRSASDSDSADFALARYNTDGSLDTSFGSGGRVITDISGHVDIAQSVAVTADGRVLVGGYGSSQSSALDPTDDSTNFELARYNSNGSLDASFGAGGKVITDLFGHGEKLAKILIQADGKILAVGFSQTTSGIESRDFAVVRYNADGSLDSDFGEGGKVTTDFFGHDDAAGPVAIGRDGKIVVAGFCDISNNPGASGFRRSAIARYKANGRLDNSFGSVGKVTTDSAALPDGVSALLLQPDDKILAAGDRQTTISSSSEDFALTRYNEDGSLDTSFAAGGRVITDFFGNNDVATAVALQADGKIVLAGYAFINTSPSTSIPRFALARYVGDAGPDFTFGFEQSSVAGERGTTAKIHVLINRTGGFTGNITITAPEATGIKVKPADPVSTTDQTATFKLKIKDSAPIGPQLLTFTASDNAGRVKTATVTVVIE
jgi:uncharacterized delta-60 repeat protein